MIAIFLSSGGTQTHLTCPFLCRIIVVKQTNPNNDFVLETWKGVAEQVPLKLMTGMVKPICYVLITARPPCLGILVLKS